MSNTDTIIPIEELAWYYADSAAEVGLHGQGVPIQTCVVLPDTSGPSQTQMTAARRQTTVRLCLRRLSTEHQVALESCYEPRKYPPQALAMFGVAAGAAVRAQREFADEERLLILELRLYASRDRPDIVAKVRRDIEALKLEKEKAAWRGVAVARSAHEAYRDAREAMRDEWAGELETARTEAQARRAALLAETREKHDEPRSLRETVRVVGQIARAWAREMGL